MGKLIQLLRSISRANRTITATLINLSNPSEEYNAPSSLGDEFLSATSREATDI
jgi:hypothetical protein